MLNGDGGEIVSVDLVLDGDRLYFATDGEPPQESESTPLVG